MGQQNNWGTLEKILNDKLIQIKNQVEFLTTNGKQLDFTLEQFRKEIDKKLGYLT